MMTAKEIQELNVWLRIRSEFIRARSDEDYYYNEYVYASHCYYENLAGRNIMFWRENNYESTMHNCYKKWIQAQKITEKIREKVMKK